MCIKWDMKSAIADCPYSQVIVTVQQACSHPVQLHGMCGVCGADLTEYVLCLLFQFWIYKDEY